MRSTTVTAAGLLSLVAAAAFTLPALAGDDRPGRHFPHGYLGVATEEEIDLEEGGARILRVVADSPADRSGLQEGDVVVAIGGRTVRGPVALGRAVRELSPGETVDLTVVRDGATLTVPVELGERASHVFVRSSRDGEPFELLIEPRELRESAQHRLREARTLHERRPHVGDPGVELRFIGDRPKLGVRLTGVTPELREHLGGRADAGVLVSSVVDDSPAMAAGIVVGDLIQAVDGEPVGDAGDLLRALHDADGRRLSLDVVRDGRPIVVDVDIPEAETRDVGFGPRI